MPKRLPSSCEPSSCPPAGDGPRPRPIARALITLLGVRHRGDRGARCGARHLARRAAGRTLPPVARRRLRSGPRAENVSRGPAETPDRVCDLATPDLRLPGAGVEPVPEAASGHPDTRGVEGGAFA